MKTQISELSVQSLALHTACELTGGATKLSNHLRAPARSLRRWLDGIEKPPTRVFIACIDIVLFHERHLAPEGEAP